MIDRCFYFQVSCFIFWRRRRSSQVMLWCHRDPNRVDPMVHCYDCLCRHLLFNRWHSSRSYESFRKRTSHRLTTHDRYTLPPKCLSPPTSVWSKNTLIHSCVGGVCFFLMSLALNVLIFNKISHQTQTMECPKLILGSNILDFPELGSDEIFC